MIHKKSQRIVPKLFNFKNRRDILTPSDATQKVILAYSLNILKFMCYFKNLTLYSFLGGKIGQEKGCLQYFGHPHQQFFT